MYVSGQTTINAKQDLEHFLETNARAMILFYDSWCPFCRKFLPVFEKYTSASLTSIVFGTVTNQENLEDQYQIDVVPSVLFYENGIVTKRLDGILGIGLTEKQLVDFIKTCSS